MKLTHIRIHNFRSILDVDLDVRDFLLLVGPNNAGKSSVIDAIRCFYEHNGLKFKAAEDFPLHGAQDKDSSIELSFQLTDQEMRDLAEKYRASDNILRLAKFFQVDSAGVNVGRAAGTIYGFLHDGTLDTQAFYGAKNVQSGKIGEIVYVPAISTVDEFTKMSGPSAMRELLAGIMSEVVEGGGAYRAFTDSVTAFSSAVHAETTDDGRSLVGFAEELNKSLMPWGTKFRWGDLNSPTSADILKSMLRWDLVDDVHASGQTVERFGSGFQRHFIFSLIELGARYVGPKVTKRATEFTPNMTLVLFEEPEAFLHPPQQDRLAKNLRDLATRGDWQVVCTTHSPHLVSKNCRDIPALVRLTKQNGITCKFQISEGEWEAIVDRNLQFNVVAMKYTKLAKKLREDDLTPEMESIKHFLWLNPDRCNLFFADHVLIVEGATEVAFVNRLIGTGQLQCSQSIFVLDALGKFNIHRFMHLLSALGIKHSVLHDDDAGGDEYHAEINEFIGDCRNAEFTVAIEPIPGNLEKLLNIPAAGSDHRKPQHVMYLFDSGGIDAGRVAEICVRLGRCLGMSDATSEHKSTDSTSVASEVNSDVIAGELTGADVSSAGNKDTLVSAPSLGGS